MAYALVSAGTLTSGSGSVTPAYGATPTANNLLIAWLNDPGAAFNLPSGSTWILAKSGNGGSGFLTPVGIYYRVATGGDTAPTFTNLGNALIAVVAEFSGNATVSPLDQVGGNDAATSPSTATAAATDAAAKQLMIGAAGCHYSMSSTGTLGLAFTDSANGAVAESNVGNNNSTSAVRHIRFGYGIGAAATFTQADKVTASDSNKNVDAIGSIIASFKLAPTAAFAPPFRSKSIHNALVR
jgi:hypothetical protein